MFAWGRNRFQLHIWAANNWIIAHVATCRKVKNWISSLYFSTGDSVDSHFHDTRSTTKIDSFTCSIKEHHLRWLVLIVQQSCFFIPFHLVAKIVNSLFIIDKSSTTHNKLNSLQSSSMKYSTHDDEWWWWLGKGEEKKGSRRFQPNHVLHLHNII